MLTKQPEDEQNPTNKGLNPCFLPQGRLGMQAAPAALSCPLPRASSRPAEDTRVCMGLNSPTWLLGWDAPGLLLQHYYTTAVMKKIQLQKLFVSLSAPVSIRETRAAMVQRLLAGLGRMDYLLGQWWGVAALCSDSSRGISRR